MLGKLFRRKKKEKVPTKADETTREDGKSERSMGFFSLADIGNLTPEREEEMVDWLANQILERGLETPAILFLESIKPVSVVASNLTLLYAAPFLEAFGIKGFDWAAFFNKRENVERLLVKIEKSMQKRKKG